MDCSSINTKDTNSSENDPLDRGVGNLWSSVNHIALVVSNVGRSLAFYTDIVGMKQVMRPNFDRHGAWLTMGNVDLHLIKGRPAVHSDDDLIVSHIAIDVPNMGELKRRLQMLGVQSRKNISVPNPAFKENGVLEQAFVRDPDGYYIEFANCESLERYIRTKMAENEKNWNLSKAKAVMKASKQLKKVANHSKSTVWRYMYKTGEDDGNESCSSMEGSCAVDNSKLINLIKRRNIYGDITQNATEEELEQLLINFDNHVPSVIAALEDKVRAKGTRTYVPPAFYGRDGALVQPPSFEMSIDLSSDIRTLRVEKNQ